MNAFILLLLTFAFSIEGYSQNIIDFFISIPDTSILRLTTTARKEIATHSIDNKTPEDAYKDMRNNGIDYAFENLDIENGYLTLIGAFEGHIQMCYWNLSNGNKLISVYQQGCGPVCYIEEFDFYEYNGKNYKPINWRTIIPDIYKDFFKGNMRSQMEEMKSKDILATLLFDLPRTGKDIIAKWGNEDLQQTYKKYGLGDRMILIWADGKFEKGQIYWKN